MLKTIVITGVTSGIGKELVKICIQKGMYPILVARDELKVKNFLEEIKESGLPSELQYFIGDLSILEEVFRIGEEIIHANPVIDGLVNNAGVFIDAYIETIEGYELTLAVNHLSPALLTYLLLPSLYRSEDAHILNLSSAAHLGGKIHWNRFRMKKHNHGFRAYNQSKLLILMFSQELARKLKGTTVKINTIHPGIVKTNLGRKRDEEDKKKSESMMSKWVNRLGITAHKSAEGLYTVITDPRFKDMTGKYFSRDHVSPSLSRNRNKQKKVWKITNSLLIETLGDEIQDVIGRNIENVSI